MSVCAGIPTKNRYDTLVLTLEGVAMQTHKPDHIIIVDDSDEPIDVRTLPAYQNIFYLFNSKNITFEYIYGHKRGQHHSHQLIQEKADTDWIWRVDDDEIPEPNVLEGLLKHAKDDVGAVGGLVLRHDSPMAPPNVQSVIGDPNQTIQWFKHAEQRVIEVDHLHSSFLYKRGVERYNLHLSPAAHREETLFTYGLKRQGLKLLVDTSLITWHFPGQGGIRAHQKNPQFWSDDDKIFQSQLNEWGIGSDPTKYIVLDCGRGDHVVVKALLPRIKERYPKLVMATCYKDIIGDDVEQISIAEAYARLGPLERFSIYGWMIDHKWNKELIQAYEKMFDL